MKVLMFSLDRKILEKDSAVQKRLIALAEALGKNNTPPAAPTTPSRGLDTPPRAGGVGSAPLHRGELTVLVPEKGNKAQAFFRLWREAKRLLNPSPHQNAVLPLGKGELKRYDLITVQDTAYLALLAYLLAQKFSVPFEVQVHGLEKFYGVRRMLAGFVLARADRIRVVSERLKRELDLRFKIYDLSSRMYVLPVYTQLESLIPACAEAPACVPRTGRSAGRLNPLSLTSTAPNPSLEKEGRKPCDVFTFLTVGRLVPVKNIAMQIRAFARLTKEYLQARLRIVGDGAERESLKSKVKSLKLGEKIEFFGQQNDVSKFYEEADAFLLTSDHEGWGLAVTEAAAYGLPIIMTDVGLAGEFIKNEENGLVVPVGDDGALVAAMRRIIGDAEIRARFGAAARRAFLALPSKEEQIQKQVEEWKNLASRNTFN